MRGRELAALSPGPYPFRRTSPRRIGARSLPEAAPGVSAATAVHSIPRAGFTAALHFPGSRDPNLPASVDTYARLGGSEGIQSRKRESWGAAAHAPHGERRFESQPPLSFSLAGVERSRGSETGSGTRSPESAVRVPGGLGRVDELLCMPAAVTPEEVRSRRAAGNQLEVHVLAAPDHVAQQPVEAINRVERRIGLETDAGSGRSKAFERRGRLLAVALALLSLRRVDLNEPNGSPVREDERVAVDDVLDRSLRSPRRVVAGHAAGRERSGQEQREREPSKQDRHATLSRGAARARWPSRSSKPVRSGSPRLGRFDSCAAP
jgi:hypothetical protein